MIYEKAVVGTKRNSRIVYIFDMDGVLVNGPFKRGVFPEVCKVLRPYVIASYDDGEEDITKRIMNAIQSRVRSLVCEGYAMAAYDWDAVLNWVAQKFGYPDSLDITRMVEKYCTMPGYVSLCDKDVPEVLDILRSKGGRLVILTNGFLRYQRPVLESLGLLSKFDIIVTPTEIGTVKPDPEAFEGVLRLTQTMETDATDLYGVVVGDSLSQDIWGANKAGLISVWKVDTLPTPWRMLDPKERASADGMLEYLRAHLERELYYQACRQPRLEECVPCFVIETIRELVELDLNSFWSKKYKK